MPQNGNGPMIDWSALQEMDVKLQHAGKRFQRILGEAHELDLFRRDASAGKTKPESEAKAFLKGLPDAAEIRDVRFILESALAEKASPLVITDCIVSQLFSRAIYNFPYPRSAFMEDIFVLLEENEPTSSLAVFRAIRNIGRQTAFVPPAGRIADSILSEESHLHSQIGTLARLERLHGTWGQCRL